MDAFFLSDTYLLRGAAIGDIDSIQNFSEIVDFADGDAIVSAGEERQDIMVLARGRARVVTADGDLIDELRGGEMIGEVSFLDGKGRTATVVAQGPCRVMVIPAERLRELMRRNPALETIILRNATLALCQRLREANQQFASRLSLL